MAVAAEDAALPSSSLAYLTAYGQSGLMDVVVVETLRVVKKRLERHPMLHPKSQSWRGMLAHQEEMERYMSKDVKETWMCKRYGCDRDVVRVLVTEWSWLIFWTSAQLSTRHPACTGLDSETEHSSSTMYYPMILRRPSHYSTSPTRSRSRCHLCTPKKQFLQLLASVANSLVFVTSLLPVHNLL